jgi:PE-PPE domain-containing protein
MRHQRGLKKRANKLAAALAVAATATALAVGPVTPAPEADAMVYTVHPFIFRLLDAVGLGVPGASALPSDPAVISQTLINNASIRNTDTVIAFGYGSIAAGMTIPALNAHDWPVGVNNVNMVLIANPGRANGGILPRFSPLFNLVGIDPLSGNVEPYTRCELTTCRIYAPTKNDVTWAYEFFSDFPITPNPFSIANSIAAAIFVTNLLGETADFSYESNQNTYTTRQPNDLALLEPVRLPTRLLGMIGINLPNPIADALQPALTILVNIGYTDVQTPSEGGTYNRTYDQFNTNKPFLSESPLTLDEYLRVPGDVIEALINGIVSQLPLTTPRKPSTTHTVETVSPAEAQIQALPEANSTDVLTGGTTTRMATIPREVVDQATEAPAPPQSAKTVADEVEADGTGQTGAQEAVTGASKPPDATVDDLRKKRNEIDTPVEDTDKEIDAPVERPRKRADQAVANARQSIHGTIKNAREPLHSVAGDAPTPGDDDAANSQDTEESTQGAGQNGSASNSSADGGA